MSQTLLLSIVHKIYLTTKCIHSDISSGQEELKEKSIDLGKKVSHKENNFTISLCSSWFNVSNLCEILIIVYQISLSIVNTLYNFFHLCPFWCILKKIALLFCFLSQFICSFPLFLLSRFISLDS